VSLVPENTEDMWHAYNLISEGDFVSCSTIRYIEIYIAFFLIITLYLILIDISIFLI